MVTGPAGAEVTAVPWRRGLLVWMLIMLAETFHGMVRNSFIAPVTGDLRARQIGVLVGSLIVLGIAWACAGWLGARSRRAQLLSGASWVVLTVIFEMLLGRALGLGWDRIVSDYNPARGGYMIAGLAVMFVAPMLAMEWRRTSPGRTS